MADETPIELIRRMGRQFGYDQGGDKLIEAAGMLDWQRVPDEIDTDKAPFDGEPVLLYADSATVDVVRLAWWDNGDAEGYGEPEDRGWWSAKHSVTSEHISDAPGCHWSHWKPFDPPSVK